MDCKDCGGQLPTGAAFCPRCGARQVAPGCAGCGAELVADAAFCFVCGTPVAPADQQPPGRPRRAVAERRLTSVLFADLVSYTTISERRDTEEVRELLSAYFETCSTVVRRYGGVVEKFIGDAVMAVWGVPTAQEDDAERAVRAGLELVEQITVLGERLGLPELALRVGIVTGEVAATLGATDQGMVAGDPVNTAARVQAKAGPEEVWVDETTRSLTAAAITYTDAGEHELKGKAEPVRLHRAGRVVAAVGGLQRIDGLEAPLVGRDRELRLLKELLHAAQEGGRPHLVVVDGEGGIGKSRLAWELEKYADGLTDAFRWHRGRCLSYGDGVAFWALAEAVRGRVGTTGDEAGPALLAGLDRLLDEIVVDEAERAWLRPRVASLLGGELLGSGEPRELAREDLFAAWARFLERVAGGNPLVLVIDDAQHMDDGLADFVDFLVTRSAFACFVVLLARPELLEQRPHLGGRRATPVRLEPLRHDDMERLVDGLVDGLNHDLCEALAQRAGGIPLYAVETVRALIDRDLVVPREGHYVVAEDGDLDLTSLGPPASLHALVAARLDALPSTQRRVLSDASVLGEAFNRDGVVILAPDVPDLDEVLDDLVDKQLLAIEVDRFSAERGQYRFRQTVVRQVAYGTLSRRDRRDRHLAVAEHLEGGTERADDLAPVVAQHLLDAADLSGEDEAGALRTRAADLFVRAGERAFGLGAYADAARSWSTALERLSEGPARARVLQRQSEALAKVNRHDEALAAATEATELFDAAGEVLAAGETAFLQAFGLSRVDRVDESERLMLARLEALDGLDVGDPTEIARVRGKHLSGLSNLYVFSGRWDQATPHLMEGLRLSNRVDDPTTFSFLLNALAMHQSSVGSLWVARSLLRAMTERARETEHWEALSVALINLAVQEASDDLDRARSLVGEAREVAVTHGLGVEDVIYANLLSYGFMSGRWDLVRAELAEVVASPVPVRMAEFTAAAATGLLRWAGADVPCPVPVPDRDYTGIYRGLQEYAEGSAALGAGEHARAVERLSLAVDEEVRNVGLYDDANVLLPVSIFAAVDAGVPLPQSIVAVGRMVREEAGPSTLLYGYARLVRALVAMTSDPQQGDGHGASEADLRETAERLERGGSRVWAARTHELLGTWLLEQGRAQEAYVELTAAEAAYESFGAPAWLERVRGRLAATRAGTAPLQ